MTTFASPRQLAAILLCTAAALFGLERWLVPTDAAAQASPASPLLVLSFRAPCSPKCQSQVEEAVLRLGPVGLGDTRPVDGGVNVAVVDLARVDFVALIDALRSAGLSLQAITLRGQPNLILDASLPDACCEDDSVGLTERMRHHVMRQQNLSHELAWIESIAIVAGANGPVARVTAKANVASVNVLEALDAIEAAGIVPHTLKLYGAEGQR